MNKPNLICIVGPTAVGKTDMAIELAQTFQTEIVSADSRQFYRELEIGTAKPTVNQLNTVPHHFINSLSIHDTYDAGRFEQEALEKLENLFEENNVVLMVGGSGLFVDVVCNGMDKFPIVTPELREKLNEEFNTKGLAVLQEELKKKDPVYYAQADIKNYRRVIRALEVIRTTGLPFSGFRKTAKKERPFNTIKIGLEMDRELLYKRIDQRMDKMIARGLFDEAKQFVPFSKLNALQTVGYKEIFGFLQGDYDLTEAIRLLKQNSRRYAKRQLTWFKKDHTITWFNPDSFKEISGYLSKKLNW